jgi:hypothetical protein
MKNKLWIFGCSFSTGFKGGDLPWPDEMTWPQLVADNLNLELDNSAHPGQCNWVSILQFIDRRDEIQKGDVVIFEFTFFDRYNVYPTRAQLIDLEDFIVRHNGTLDGQTEVMRDVNFNWFKKQVWKFCKEKGIDIYLWSAEGNTHFEFDRYAELYPFIHTPTDNIDNPTFAIYNLWQNMNDDQHIIKTNGKVDRHFNDIGHLRLAEHFVNCIKNNIQYTYKKSVI